MSPRVSLARPSRRKGCTEAGRASATCRQNPASAAATFSPGTRASTKSAAACDSGCASRMGRHCSRNT
ncbi:MAG TPA: hypothetical protein PLC40_01765, partial [Candidatus Hydrogenedentes bacterium]|nr:hypothetical protein [Candidatus Hydrogenedentota bacterium]